MVASGEEVPPRKKVDNGEDETPRPTLRRKYIWRKMVRKPAADVQTVAESRRKMFLEFTEQPEQLWMSQQGVG